MCDMRRTIVRLYRRSLLWLVTSVNVDGDELLRFDALKECIARSICSSTSAMSKVSNDMDRGMRIEV